MTTTAQSIIKEVALKILTDASGTRWSATDLVDVLNRMQRIVASARPDATAASSTLTLIAGHAQVLPSTAAALMEILSNAAGTKGAVRQCPREDLDAVEPGWRNRTQASTIQNYMLDTRHPRRFDVYPPAIVGTQVEAIVSAYPLDVAAPSAPGLVYTTVSGNIGLPDEFAPALVHLVAYGAYLRDAEYAANAQLAGLHLQGAVNIIGEQLRSLLDSKPMTAEDASK